MISKLVFEALVNPIPQTNFDGLDRYMERFADAGIPHIKLERSIRIMSRSHQIRPQPFY